MAERPQGYEDEGMFWVRIEPASVSVVCKFCNKKQTVVITNQKEIIFRCCNPLFTYNFSIS